MSGKSKCLCVAYENLHASQEDFFKNRTCEIGEEVFDKLREHDAAASEELESNLEIKKPMEKETGGNGDDDEVILVELSYGRKDAVQKDAAAMLKRSRDNLPEETRRSVMAVSSGRVTNLVKEFEKLSVLKAGDSNEEVDEQKKDVGNKELPAEASDLQVSSSSFSPSDVFLTTENLGLDCRRSYSLDSQKSFSTSRSTSAGGQKPRRKSTEPSGNRARRSLKKKQQKATSLKPFMLKTEERGRFKEEEFMKKLEKR